MKRLFLLLWGCAVWAACDGDSPDAAAALGTLQLSLSSHAGGVEYRLSEGRFSLEGPERREFAAGPETAISLELTPGVYQLTLLPGYRLSRADDPSESEVPARLVTANPATVMVKAGETSHLTLRFELANGQTTSQPGTLAIDLAVDVPDAGAAPCTGALRIDEIDYEQAGTDESELVEVHNPGPCPAALAGVALELVNGGDGKAYARYDLSSVAPSLEPGARLVLGDSSVLMGLPQGTLSLALNGSGLQNGPDAVRLTRGEALLDAVAYEGEVTGIAGPVAPADEGDGALSRCAGVFKLAAPSPGAANACTP